MPKRRTHSAPTAIKARNPMRDRSDRDMRNYNSIRGVGGGSAPRPSRDFNWDKALLLHALAMWDLGYPLSAEQKRRIEEYSNG